jgi:hypothetical protein
MTTLLLEPTSTAQIDWELTFKAIAAVGIPIGLILTWWTHSQRSTFEMIDRLYSLCHTLQGHALREWRLSHLYCIGSDLYDETRNQVQAGITDPQDRIRLSVEEREFAIHILVTYEQVYYQWKHSRALTRRRDFLDSMLAYFTDRLLRNPRIVGLLSTDSTGVSFHLETESMRFLAGRWARCPPVRPDLDGPFTPTALSLLEPAHGRARAEGSAQSNTTSGGP